MKKIRLLLKFKNISLKFDYLSNWLLFGALCLLVAYLLVKFWLQCILLFYVYL